MPVIFMAGYWGVADATGGSLAKFPRIHRRNLPLIVAALPSID
jgi:hypothetical protein